MAPIFSNPELSDQDLLAEAKRLSIGVARNLAARIEKADDEQAPALVVAFERANLVLRRTILLAEHFAGTEHVRDFVRAQGRKRILRQVDDAIEAKNLPAETAAQLRVELLERVESPDLGRDLDADILAGRTAEAIENLKRDLGVSARPFGRNAPRRTPDDVATLLARAHNPPPPAPVPPGTVATGALRHNISTRERRSSA